MKKERGLTLIEIMVVVVILGILAAVSITQLWPNRDKAARITSVAAVQKATDAIQHFRLEHGRLPRTLDELVFRPDDIDPAKWTALSLKPPVDGWERPLLYNPRGSDGFPFDVISLGADGREGGEGFDEDLWNHARRP